MTKKSRRKAMLLTHPDKNLTCIPFANKIYNQCQIAGERFNRRKQTGFTPEEEAEKILAYQEFKARFGW